MTESARKHKPEHGAAVREQGAQETNDRGAPSERPPLQSARPLGLTYSSSGVVRRDLDTDTDTDTEAAAKPKAPDVLYMDPSGVGHAEPDKSKAPDVLYMDSGGVGHKEPDKSKAPDVLFMDAFGVGHKEADKAKAAPGVLFMDAFGVGHKEPDKAPALPKVLHMDAGGVGHDLTKDPGEVLRTIRIRSDGWAPHCKVVAEEGEKLRKRAEHAKARGKAADTALTQAENAWVSDAADAGLIAARSADTAKQAKDDLDKNLADADKDLPTLDTALGKVNWNNGLKNLEANLNRFPGDKSRWLADTNGGPLAKGTVAEIERVLTEDKARLERGKQVRAAKDAWYDEVADAADLAKTAAEETAEPMAKGTRLYAITGTMQQKLNLLTPKPRISVTALFDDSTELKLKAFQKQEGLPETGIADVATWTALNAKAPSEQRNESLRVENVEESHTARPDDGWHPTVHLFSSGPAVRELQNRLNNYTSSVTGEKPFSPMSVDGIFGLKTAYAVRQFQKAKGLSGNGIADKETWEELDKVGAVSAGARDFNMTQRVEGMLTGVNARYMWEVKPGQKLVVTAEINFTGLKTHPMVAKWLQDIRDVWNGFKAVEVGGAREYDIEFNPVVASSGHSVRVGDKTADNPNPRSNAANWYVSDTRKGLAPHEFGHLIGLDDEYNRPEGQYVETTGQEPKIGSFQSETGKNSTQVADLLHTAITTNQAERGEVVAAALAKVVKDENLTQGSFTRRVAQRYEEKYGFDGAGDITEYFAKKSDRNWTRDLTIATTAFSESNTSVMGLMTSVRDDATGASLAALAPHDHPVQPRHLRSFTDLLVLAMPGSKWKTAKR